MATAKVIDLTNVKEGGQFSKRRIPAGDYPARITKVSDEKAKGDGEFQWLFTIDVEGGGTYPYYCKLVESQLWKVRNLCIAAGINVPKKKLKLDPERLVGKRIAVTMEDDEYDGKPQSSIYATFPLSELDDAGIGDADDADDLDDEEEEVTPPPKKKGTKKAAPEPEPEEDEEEDDEEDEEDEEEDELAGLNRDQLKRRLRKAVPGVKISRKQSDDDLRDAIRAAEGGDEEEDDEEEDDAPPPKKTKKRSTKVADVTDDELEELDIDEI